MSVEVKNLTFAYEGHEVLRGLNFSVPTGCLTTLLGPNGVGKSTLFRCVLGLLTDYSGSCVIDGRDTRGMSARELSRLVAYIPQSHYPSFNFSVIDMVLMGTTAQIGGLSTPGAAQIKKCESALEQLEILHLRDRGYTHLSGGERQLVLIARALVQDAKLLIMDEPTANLDYGNALRVMAKAKELTRSSYTVILSTHDPNSAFRWADSMLALSDGTLVACGTPSEAMDSALIRRLYGIEVDIISAHDGAPLICVPTQY